MDLYTKERAYRDKERVERTEEYRPRSCALFRFWSVGGGVTVNASM